MLHIAMDILHKAANFHKYITIAVQLRPL